MKALVFGSLNYDYVYQVDHMVREKETLNSHGLQMHLGGKGFNQAVALKKAGLDVYLAGALGEDCDIFLEACKNYGINTDFIDIKKGRSGHTIIQVDKDAQNSILLYGGANRDQSIEHIDEVMAHFGQGDLLILQNEISLLDYVLDMGYARGMQVILNPSPYDAAINYCDISKVSMLFLNEVEGEMMTGQKQENDMLAALKKSYPGTKVVLTLGTEGAYYQDAAGSSFQPAFKVDAKDTTAAGDTFTGYFLASQAAGLDEKEALRRAAYASSITVTRDGAAESIPCVDEIKF